MLTIGCAAAGLRLAGTRRRRRAGAAASTTALPVSGNIASLTQVTISATRMRPIMPPSRGASRGHPRLRRVPVEAQVGLVAGVRRGCRATSARIAARSGRSAPSARACTSTLPSAAASAGPASTGRPQASAVSRQSRSLCEPPPDDVHDARRRGRPGGRPCADLAAVGQRQAVEDAAGHRHRASAAPARPASAASAADPGRHVARAGAAAGRRCRRRCAAAARRPRRRAALGQGRRRRPTRARTRRAPRAPSRCAGSGSCRRRRPRW